MTDATERSGAASGRLETDAGRKLAALAVVASIAVGFFVAVSPLAATVLTGGLFFAAVATLVPRQAMAPAIAVATLSLSVLPAVPSLGSPLPLLTGAAAATAWAASLAERPDRPRWPEAFLLYLGLSLLWADGSLTQASRAMIPFIFLLLYRCARNSATSVWLRAAELAGVALALRVFWVAASGIGRATWHSLDFILPLHLVGALLATDRLLHGSRGRTRYLAAMSAAGQLAALVLTQTRGLVLGLLAGIGLLGVRRRSRALAWLAVLGLLGALLMSLALRPEGEATDLLFSRFSYAGIESGWQVRLEEARAAAALWWTNPVFGMGLGTTFVNPVANSDVPVSYVHNSLLYMLLSGGAIAAAMYGWIIYKSVRDNLHQPGVAAAALAIAVFGLTTAGFRSVHFNVLLALAYGAGRRAHPERNEPLPRVTEGQSA